MSEPQFAPGFRLSLRDVIVLLLGAAASTLVAFMHLWIGLAIAFVVLHFFLFCNVLRITRPPELIWAAIFSGLVVCTTVYAIPNWPAVIGISLAVTLLIACVEVRRASYHGIGWQKINPRLPQWWQDHVAQTHDPT